MNSIEMKVVMKRNQDTQEKLAEALDLPVSGVNARINGSIAFRAGEMKLIKERYNLSAEDVVNIFF